MNTKHIEIIRQQDVSARINVVKWLISRDLHQEKLQIEIERLRAELAAYKRRDRQAEKLRRGIR